MPDVNELYKTNAKLDVFQWLTVNCFRNTLMAAASRSVTLSKRDSNKGVFMRLLQNF